MTEYTPDKDSVEMHYVTGAVAANPGLTQIQACAEFDRFLARVRQEAKAEALDGLAEQEARACDRDDLTPESLHIHASILACVEMYASDLMTYAEETPNE